MKWSAYITSTIYCRLWSCHAWHDHSQLQPSRNVMPMRLRSWSHGRAVHEDVTAASESTWTAPGYFSSPLREARRIGFSGIGISQKGDKSSRFIHLDILTWTALWSYWAIVGWSNRFTFEVFIVSYSSFQRGCDVMRKKGDYEVAFRWFSSEQNAREFSISTMKI